MTSKVQAVLAITTVASDTDAVKLVRGLLEQRLIACGTMLPEVRSMYRWEGRLVDESETLILLKTTADRVDALKSALAAMHDYQVPELLTFVASDGLPGYLAWLAAEVSLAE
jgi:periplasmic divalent cation tolerance protein